MPSGQYEQIVGPLERLRALGIDTVSLVVNPETHMDECRVSWQDIVVTGIGRGPGPAVENAETKLRSQIVLQHPEVILP